MSTSELACSVAGNEAKALLYSNLPPETVLAFTGFNQIMNALQDGAPEYVPAPLTYFKYTTGFTKSGLGESASYGRIKQGFSSYADEKAKALGGDLLTFSFNRPNLGLSDLFEANRTEYFPRVEAIRLLLDEPDGLSFSDLTEHVYGDEDHRYRTAKDVFVHQLVKRGLMNIASIKGAGVQRGPKTRITLLDSVVEDCHAFIDVLDVHENPTEEAIASGLARGESISSDSDVVRGLIGKSFKRSPWTQAYPDKIIC